MGMGSAKGTTGVIGGVAKAAPPPGAAVAAEAAGGIGTAGKVALGAGAAAGAGLAARALFTNREKQFARTVSKFGDKGDAAVRASLDNEAAQGGAWNDPTWPARLHRMLTFRSDHKPPWAADVVVRERREDYTTEGLRAAWLGYFHVNGAAMERNLYP
jgi:hypothetical protein